MSIKLRDRCEHGYVKDPIDPCPECERDALRAALRDIRDMGPMTVDDQRWRIAKAALEGKQ